jgi:hypothetical protein
MGTTMPDWTDVDLSFELDSCPHCDGPFEWLGCLGRTHHHRCRDCGTITSQQERNNRLSPRAGDGFTVITGHHN